MSALQREYQETIDYLFNTIPAFFRAGKTAVKKDLRNIRLLCDRLGDPQSDLKCIHIAGTNGKGSVSHILASLYQASGLKVGLYTSPHYVDFRERIKINGECCDQQFVIDFVSAHRDLFEEIIPSFFEVTVAMAFQYFKEQSVDLAIIETGLGGRLDSTNIIESQQQIITTIGFDHMDFLGNTLEEIAGEKAGIIKTGGSVVIGETIVDSAREVILAKASEKRAVVEATESVVDVTLSDAGEIQISTGGVSCTCPCDLSASYQADNLKTALAAYMIANEPWEESVLVSILRRGLADISRRTGMIGRWQQIQDSPVVIVDGAHNEQAFEHLVKEIERRGPDHCIVLLGFSADKDVQALIDMLPAVKRKLFTSAAMSRAMSKEQFQEISGSGDFEMIENSSLALSQAIALADEDDVVICSGSIYLVGELLASRV